MNDCSCPCPCTMKLDLQKSSDKLAFIKENWYEILQPSYISTLSPENLKCAFCLINFIVGMIESGEYQCANQCAIRLVRLSTYIGNCISINECKQELAELEEQYIEKRE